MLYNNCMKINSGPFSCSQPSLVYSLNGFWLNNTSSTFHKLLCVSVPTSWVSIFTEWFHYTHTHTHTHTHSHTHTQRQHKQRCIHRQQNTFTVSLSRAIMLHTWSTKSWYIVMHAWYTCTCVDTYTKQCHFYSMCAHREYVRRQTMYWVCTIWG